MVMRLGIIVQAHIGSTRLPNKMLKDLAGEPVLTHVLRRLKRVRGADALIVATSDLPGDDAIVALCEREGVATYRGSDSDVLARFYGAATEYRLTAIARACADNTLIDPGVIDAELAAYRTGRYPLVGYSAHVPLGLGVEVFSYAMLSEAYECATEHYHHEHVTPYIYEHFGEVYRVPFEPDYSRYRFTLDTAEDWALISAIYGELYHGTDDITLADVIALMEHRSELYELNSHVHQKGVKE